MPTFLFNSTIFGPVKSRRLGVSLGINLLPDTRKLCNFNCIYCECGWNPESQGNEDLPGLQLVSEQLSQKLEQMKTAGEALDVITFAGNGEPTMHPQFAEIVDACIGLRNKYFPGVKIAVLSNATLVHKPAVFEALKKVDQNIQKLDSAIEQTCRVLNKPTGYFNVTETIHNLARFEGKMILQTMFVKGVYQQYNIDNTTPAELEAWCRAIEKIKPSQVMIYTIARDTPAEGLRKIDPATLNKIAQTVVGMGYPVSISG